MKRANNQQNNRQRRGNNKASGNKSGNGKAKSRVSRTPYENTQLAWDSVVKDELVSAVNGSVALSATEYAINPGVAATFPLGSAEAAKWTEWKCEYIEFYYRRTVSEFATQGTTGRVVLACDYSALNGAPETLQEAEALHCAMGMPCDEEIRLRLDPRIVNKADPKYVRTQEPSGHSDIRLFDGGNMWFVVSGCQNATEIGELRARYHFKVRLPNLNTSDTPQNTTVSQFNLSADQSASGTTVTVAFNEQVANGTGVTNASGVFTMPAGNFLITAEVGWNASYISALVMELDSSAMVPPCTAAYTATGATLGQLSLTRYVQTTAGQEIRIRATGSSTCNLDQDACRITFLLL